MEDFNTKTPAWLFNPEIAVSNLEEYYHYFKEASIAYAVKSNPHPSLVMALHRAKAGFCVVSSAHLQQVLSYGAKPSDIHYSHTIKSLEEIQFALEKNIRCFACDSKEEIDKMAFINSEYNVTNSSPVEIFMRLNVSNSDAIVSLSGKFGVATEQVLELMAYAVGRGLKPVGFTFHVGSQCLTLAAWEKAIKTVASIWEAARRDFSVDFLNIGGGFAAPYKNTQQPALSDVAKTVNAAIQHYLPGVKRLVLEPGRAIVATAGSLLTSVTGMAERSDGQTWLFVDAGVFTGLFETLDGIHYPVTVLPPPENSLQSAFKQAMSDKILNQPETGKVNKLYTYMLAGPTCDSLDKLFTITTAQPVCIGDRLLFGNTGAYGYSLESDFNGYSAPTVKIVGSSNQQVTRSVSATVG